MASILPRCLTAPNCVPRNGLSRLSCLRTPRKSITCVGLSRQFHAQTVLQRTSPNPHARDPNEAPSGLWNMLESGPSPSLKVRTVGAEGICLDDGLLLPGPCIFLEGQVYLWDAPSSFSKDLLPEWNESLFEIFDVIVPKPEILLFGTGKSLTLLPPSIKAHINSLGIPVDIMDTRNACSTYNVLSEEGRRIAAAILPVVPYRWEKKSHVSDSP